MKLFIDTNIYLDYFRTSSESLASLKALKKLLLGRRITLLVPSQTKDEYFRNKDREIEKTRNELIEQKGSRGFNKQIPAVKGWKEARDVEKKIKDVRKAYEKLLEKYDDKTSKEKMAVDFLIKGIFKLGKELIDNEDILKRAYFRHMKGNPPRKNDHSFGDAIVWELLLADEQKDNLSIITRDTDFICANKKRDTLDLFLVKEWKEKTRKEINFYISLGAFINCFEKKQIIKKEIVQEEEKRGQRAITDSVSMSGMINLDPLSFTQTVRASDFDLISRPPFTALQATEGLYNFASNMGTSLKFCPYCGEDIRGDIIRDFKERRLQYITLSDNKFICPHCKTKFRLDGL